MLDVNATIPLQLVINDVTGCQAILTSNTIIDSFKIQPKWITLLQFWIGQISKFTANNGKEC